MTSSWFGTLDSVKRFLENEGADRNADGFIIATQDPDAGGIVVGIGGHEVVIADHYVYFVDGDPRPLAAGLNANARGGLMVKVF